MTSLQPGAPVGDAVTRSLHVAARQVRGLPGTLIDDLDVDIVDYHPRLRCLGGVAADATGVRNPGLASAETNCLVTGQPDWAVYVNYTGAPIDRAGLLRLHRVLSRAQRVPRAMRRAHVLRFDGRRCAPSRLEVGALHPASGWPSPAQQRGGAAAELG